MVQTKNISKNMREKYTKYNPEEHTNKNQYLSPINYCRTGREGIGKGKPFIQETLLFGSWNRMGPLRTNALRNRE